MKEAGILTVGMAAKLLMMSARRIQQLAAAGWFARNADGKYNVVDVVQGHIRYMHDDARKATQTAAKTTTEQVKARMAELKLAKLEGELIEVDEHLAIVDFLAGAIRTEFSSLPANYTRDLRERDRLQDALDGVLTRLSETFAKKSVELDGKRLPAR